MTKSTAMKDRILVPLFALLALAVSLMMTSCNTVRGVGQDVSHVGSSVANAAN